MGKNSLTNFICHLSWLEKLSPTHTHPLKTSHEFLTASELLFSELESLIKCWMWIGKDSLTNFMCHLWWLKELSPAHTHPLRSSHEFSKPYVWVIIFWVRVIHKMLNVNWEKIHSIILSVTCHGLRNFPLLIHIPSKPVMNCWNPVSYYFLS